MSDEIFELFYAINCDNIPHEQMSFWDGEFSTRNLFGAKIDEKIGGKFLLIYMTNFWPALDSVGIDYSEYKTLDNVNVRVYFL